METLALQLGAQRSKGTGKKKTKGFDQTEFIPPKVVTCHDILMNNIEENLMDM